MAPSIIGIFSDVSITVVRNRARVCACLCAAVRRYGGVKYVLYCAGRVRPCMSARTMRFSTMLYYRAHNDDTHDGVRGPFGYGREKSKIRREIGSTTHGRYAFGDRKICGEKKKRITGAESKRTLNSRRRRRVRVGIAH